MARIGVPSPKHGDNGIWYLSTGDAGLLPRGPIHIVQYDEQDNVVWELVHSLQDNGDGHVSFLGTHDRPSSGGHFLHFKVPSTGFSKQVFSCTFDAQMEYGTMNTFLSAFLGGKKWLEVLAGTDR